MEERRGGVKRYIATGNSKARNRKPVGPWVQKRNTRRTAFGRGCVKILQAPQKFFAAEPQRHAEHTAAGQKHGFEISRGQFALGMVHVSLRKDAPFRRCRRRSHTLCERTTIPSHPSKYYYVVIIGEFAYGTTVASDSSVSGVNSAALRRQRRA